MSRKEDFLIKNELVSLTTLRGVAVLWVAIYHYKVFLREYSIDLNIFSKIAEIGYLGVDFFFILSGFIISYVYGGVLSKPGKESIFRFLGFRLARIYPLHVAVLLICLLLAYVFKIDLNTNVSLKSLILNLLNIHGWGLVHYTSWNEPSWSISVEWFIYLIFPVLIILVSRVRGTISNIFLILALAVGMFFYFKTNGFQTMNLYVYSTLARGIWEFVVGMCLFNIYKNKIYNSIIFDFLFLFNLLALVLTILLFKPFLLRDFICILILSSLILCVVQSSLFVKNVLSVTFLYKLGKISYSIYMIHWLCLSILTIFIKNSFLLDKILILFVYFISTISLACVLYHKIEVPSRYYFREKFVRNKV